MPAAAVEAAVERHIVTVGLPTEFTTALREFLVHNVEDRTAMANVTKHSLEAQLAKLGQEEERLLDLAADPTLNRPGLKARLRKLHVKRDSFEAQLKETTPTMANNGAEVLDDYLQLLTAPEGPYSKAPNVIRRRLLETFFTQLRLDVDGVQTDERTEPIAEIHQAAQALLGSPEIEGAHPNKRTPWLWGTKFNSLLR